MKYFKFFLLCLLLASVFSFSQVRETAIDEVQIKMVKKLKKKDNPAFEIMQEVWKRKKNNGLSQFQDYQYEEYEKVEVDLATLILLLLKEKFSINSTSFLSMPILWIMPINWLCLFFLMKHFIKRWAETHQIKKKSDRL